MTWTLYRFVIDTTWYAGSFERELCAFVTGQIGEDEVGQEIVDQLSADDLVALAWTFEALRWERSDVADDDDNLQRPVTIMRSPATEADSVGEYSSVAILLSRLLSDTELQQLGERTRRFMAAYTRATYAEIGGQPEAAPDHPITITGFRLLDEGAQTLVASWAADGIPR